MTMTTIQLTSKKLKLHGLLAGLCIIGGFFGAGISPENGAISAGILLVGMVWYVVTKIRIWWNHA